MEELTEVIGTEPAQYEGGFLVDTEDKAVWCAGKVAKAENHLAALKAAKAEYIRRIEEWYEQRKKEHEDTANRMIELLRPYATQQVARSNKKSVVLPDGTKVGFKSLPGKVEIGSMDQVVQWAESQAPGIVRVKKDVTKTDLKALIKERGEIPPSVEMLPGETRFYVDVTGESEV